MKDKFGKYQTKQEITETETQKKIKASKKRGVTERRIDKMDGRKILIKYYFPEPSGHGAPSETDENKVIPEHITVKFQNTTDKREKKIIRVKNQESKYF